MMGVGLLIVHPCDALRAVALRISAVRRADFSTHCNLAAAAVCGRSYSRSTQNSRFSLVKSQCCKVKQSRDFNMPAAEDTNCCRLAPHPNAASDLAEGQSGVLIDNNGPETLHDASSDTSNNMLLTRKRYKDLSKQELKELQLTLLVDLQRLGTSVPVLVGEAILATDKRHCAALSATLRSRQHQAMASCFRTICMAAGHELPQDYFAPFEGQNGSRDKEEAGCMTFGKFVSSFMYYCNNSSRFRQETAQRQRCIREVQQLLRGVIQAEVSNVTNVENISDVEADQYLEEWSHADKARARSNISGGDLFSFNHGTHTPKCAADLYSRIIKLEEFVEGVPLLATLSEKVIWAEIHQCDAHATSAATSSVTDIIDT